MEEEDARSFVELLGREPGGPKKLAGIIQGRIIFLESPAPEI
jgi:hypothetical protein